MKKATHTHSPSLSSRFTRFLAVSICISVLTATAVAAAWTYRRWDQDNRSHARLAVEISQRELGFLLNHAFHLSRQIAGHPETIQLIRQSNFHRKQQKNRDRQNHAIAATPDFGDNESDRLSQTVEGQPFVERIALFDQQGLPVAIDQEAPDPTPLPEALRQPLQSGKLRPQLTMPIHGEKTNYYTNTIIYPVIAAQRTWGAVAVQLQFDAIGARMAQMPGKDDLEQLVLDPNGGLIAYSQPARGHGLLDRIDSKMAAPKASDASMLTDLSWPKSATFKIQQALDDASGTKLAARIEDPPARLLLQSVPVPHENGAFVVAVRRSPRPPARVFYLLAGAAGLLLVLLFGLLIPLYRSRFRKLVIRPMEVLADSMRSEKAASTIDLDATSIGEFRTLVHTYSEMRVRMGDSTQKLTNLNKLLEKQVEKRTQALIRLNESLVHDIRRRKEVETALRESEHLYRRTIETAPDAIIITRWNDGYFMSVNEAFCKLTGYQSSEVIEKTVFQINLYVDPKDRNRILKMVADQGEVKGFETRLRGKKGLTISVMISARPLRYQKENCLIAVITDISKRKRAEEEIQRLNLGLEKRVAQRTSQLEKANRSLKTAVRQAQQLARQTEQANRAKSEFLANMSHEIRTPMNGILGMCDLAIGKALNRKQKEYLQVIRSSARHLLGIINDVLDFSKIEAGKLHFEEISFSLRDVVEGATDVFMDRMWKKGIEMIIDMADDVPMQLKSDPLRLRQVLVNLISNAEKFTETGEICLSVRTREVSKAQVTLLFSVRDTGIGISKEEAARLFDMFTQADGSTTRKYGGTGLGLAICKRIVQMMDGEIWVDSRPGDGSTFAFTACFKPAATRSGPVQKKAPSEKLRNLPVLVVDSNPFARRVLERYLGAFELAPEAVSNATDAHKRLQQAAASGRGFKLIIMDVRPPENSGIRAVAQLRANPRYRNIPVILTSASGEDQQIREIKDAEPAGYLIKPVKKALLLSTIQGAFGLEKKRRQEARTPQELGGMFRNARVLLAEDNPINRRVMVEILELAKIRVDTAANGKEALEKIQENDYQAVLMDLQMPEMDGFECVHRVRESLGKIDLPIIAVTAHTMTGDREKCLQMGMNDYIAKPIEQREFFRVLRRHIGDNFIIEEPDAIQLADGLLEELTIAPDAYPGLDIRTGLERIGGSWNMYAEILREYCDSFLDIVPDVRALLRKKDLSTIRQRVHALKGAAGNISAPRLYDSTLKMEKACRNKDMVAVEQMVPELQSAIEELVATSEKLPVFYDLS